MPTECHKAPLCGLGGEEHAEALLPSPVAESVVTHEDGPRPPPSPSRVLSARRKEPPAAWLKHKQMKPSQCSVQRDGGQGTPRRESPASQEGPTPARGGRETGDQQAITFLVQEQDGLAVSSARNPSSVSTLFSDHRVTSLFF